MAATSVAAQKLFRTVEVYPQYALGNETGTLRKIDKSKPFSLKYVCAVDESNHCDPSSIRDKINGVFGFSDRVPFLQSRENPALTIVFTDDKKKEAVRRKTAVRYLRNYIDFGDLDCQFYTSIRDDVIEKSTIVISVDSPLVKQRVCLLFQMHQAFGLRLPLSGDFAANWPISEDGIDLRKTSDDDFVRMKKNFDTLTYIHMCADLKPGMTISEVEKYMEPSSPCLKGLTKSP